MSSKKEREYNSKLGEFWQKKQSEINSELVFRRGRKPKHVYMKEWGEKIEELEEVYRQSVKERAREQLNRLVVYKTRRYPITFWRKRRWGKRLYNTIDSWLRKKQTRVYNSKPELIGKPHVYIFWNGKKCVYVGRTKTAKNIKGGGGKWRLQNWREAKRLEIRFIRNKRNLPKAECLAKDIYEPYLNKISVSMPRYSSPCPVQEDIAHLDRGFKKLAKIKAH